MLEKEITIQKAKPEDARGIAKVHIDSWRSTYKGIIADTTLNGLSYERSERNWFDILSKPDNPNFIYLAETVDGEVVGFASGGLEREDDPVYKGEVYAIYLLQHVQGRGIGRRLMQASAKELLERGISTMLIWVLTDNTPSRKFYEAIGGKYLREKPIEIGGQQLTEVAYSWNDLQSLIAES